MDGWRDTQEKENGTHLTSQDDPDGDVPHDLAAQPRRELRHEAALCEVHLPRQPHGSVVLSHFRGNRRSDSVTGHKGVDAVNLDPVLGSGRGERERGRGKSQQSRKEQGSEQATYLFLYPLLNCCKPKDTDAMMKAKKPLLKTTVTTIAVTFSRVWTVSNPSPLGGEREEREKRVSKAEERDRAGSLPV